MKRLLMAMFIMIVTLAAVSPSVAGRKPERIVSLAPNLTEILFALGLGDEIVGVTTFCDYPEEAKKKPKIGGMSNPSLEAVISLRPDMVMVTTDGNQKEFEERLRSMNIRTHVLKARRISELPRGIREMGIALHVREKAEELARRTEETMDSFRMKTPVSPKKRVLFIVWPEPLIAAGPGTVIDDAITMIGGENIAARAKTAYPKYSIEEIIRKSPDVIVIGKGMGDMKEISAGLLKRLRMVPAVRDGKVFYVSDDLYRLGPRTARGIGELSKVLGNDR